MLFDVTEHLHHLGVGAAVEGTLQRAHGAGDGAVAVGTAGGHGAADVGGVVAAAVLSVDHEHQVEEAGFVVGEGVVLAEHPQEVLCHGELRVGIVDIEGVVIVVVALGGKGVGDDGGEPRHQLDGLAHEVLGGEIIGTVVVGVECQNAARQLVHDILAGGAEDHVLHEALGQLPRLEEHILKLIQLLPGGELAHQQQEHHLGEAEGLVLAMGFHNIFHADAAVVQLAGGGHALAVLDGVALDRADVGDAQQDAGAVCIAEAALDVGVVVLVCFKGILIFHQFLQSQHVFVGLG